MPLSPSPLTADHPASFAWRARRPAYEFEYLGRTSLTVIGPVTGKPYRFARPGARQTVEAPDGPSLAPIPGLRRVR